MTAHSVPSPLQQLDVLTAAFSRRPDAAEAWLRWRESVDWDRHLDPVSFSLLPIILRNMSSMGLQDALMPKFRGIARQAWLANKVWMRPFQKSMEVLSGANIGMLFLPPTRRLLLDTSAVLNRNDPVHLAIRRQHAEQAINLLLAVGWKSANVRLPQRAMTGFTLGTHYLLLRRDEDMQLTLNWGLEILFREDASCVWQRAVPAELCGRPASGPDAADALEFVLRHPVAEEPFGQMAEILAVASEPGLQWRRLAEALRMRPVHSDWLAVLNPLQSILSQWDADLDPADWCRAHPPRSLVPRRSVMARGIEGWRDYRASLGERHALQAAVRQLPGYLMGRWNLAAMRHIPFGFLNWAIRG